MLRNRHNVSVDISQKVRFWQCSLDLIVERVLSIANVQMWSHCLHESNVHTKNSDVGSRILSIKIKLILGTLLLLSNGNN